MPGRSIFKPQPPTHKPDAGRTMDARRSGRLAQPKQKTPGPAAPPLARDFDFSRVAILAEPAGAPLPPLVRRQAEQSLGADFSTVRVHQDGLAAATGALALARGDDLHFAPGEYRPESHAGRQLLGHELAHVVQQRRGQVPLPAMGAASVASIVEVPALEAEADRGGERLARGESGGPAAVPARVSQAGPVAMQLRRRHRRKPTEPIETNDVLNLDSSQTLNPTISPAELGTQQVGHASTGWAGKMTGRDVLDRLAQYDALAEIPYDQVRCGASALLGAAIAQGPAALTNLLDRLRDSLSKEGGHSPGFLPLDLQRTKLQGLTSNWLYTPQAGQQDEHPFTLDHLHWIQGVIFVHFSPVVEIPIGRTAQALNKADIRAKQGLPREDLQRATTELTAPQSRAAAGPGSSRLRMEDLTINNSPGSRDFFDSLKINFTKVYDRLIKNQDSQLKAGEAILLQIVQPFLQGSQWTRDSHFVTLFRDDTGFAIYNSAAEVLSDAAMMSFPPGIAQHLQGRSLDGHHVTRESDTIDSLFGLTLSLVLAVATSPFRFAENPPKAAPVQNTGKPPLPKSFFRGLFS